MEFLKGLGKGGSGTGEGDNGDALESSDQGESPTQSQGQTSQQGSSEPANAMSGNSPNPPRDPNAGSTAGASQNAMEFLKGNTGQEDGQDAGQSDNQVSGQDTGQENEKEDGQSQGGQQTETTEADEANTSSASDSPVSSSEPEEESTAGASQNALEYLTGDYGPSGDDSGTVQDTDQAEGTLSLHDLLNARGVGDTTAESPAPTNPDEESQADETKPEKDGDG